MPAIAGYGRLLKSAAGLGLAGRGARSFGLRNPQLMQAAIGAGAGYMFGGGLGAIGGGLLGGFSPASFRRGLSTRIAGQNIFSGKGRGGRARFAAMAGLGVGAGVGGAIGGGIAGAGLSAIGGMFSSVGNTYGGMSRSPYGTSFSGLGNRY